MYQRKLPLPPKSFFLFGPRGVGKSTWLAQELPDAPLKIDLLKSSQFLEYRRNPSLIRQQVRELPPKSWVVVDEVQKLPPLLDEIHSLLFEFSGHYRFALSGSSARKIKREQGNMLAGRALMSKLFPLSCLEYPQDFALEKVLRHGQLPMAVSETKKEDRENFLDSYVEAYIREEIRQEAVVRNLNSFYRFLEVVAIVNGETLNVSNIAREVGLARSTVQGYFQILQDTLIGHYLPALKVRAKVKEVSHPKFYLFDCGVQRALAGLHRETPSAFEKGKLFECYFINEVRALNSYSNLGGQLAYWRTESGTEVDLIWTRGKTRIGIEIKHTKRWQEKFNRGLSSLLDSGHIKKAYGIYLGETPLRQGDLRIFPFQKFLQKISHYLR